MTTIRTLATLAICWLALTSSTRASVTPIADYVLTDPDALGQVQGPAELLNRAGDPYVLLRRGAPRYLNLAPDPAAGRALRFDGQSAYQLEGDVPALRDDFVLEAWCRAEKSNYSGFHGVVGHGDGARGYCLVQHDA